MAPRNWSCPTTVYAGQDNIRAQKNDPRLLIAGEEASREASSKLANHDASPEQQRRSVTNPHRKTSWSGVLEARSSHYLATATVRAPRHDRSASSARRTYPLICYYA